MKQATKISKMILFMLIVANVTAVLTACQVSHFNRSEMSDYLKNQIPNKEFVISKNYVEYEGSDHNIDRVWDVYLKENPDLVFKVISDKYFSGEFAAFERKSNFKDVYGLNFYKLYTEKNYTNIKWDEGVVHEDDYYFKRGNRLYISFTNRYELKQAVEELKEFYAFLDSKGYPIELPITIEYLPEVDKLGKNSIWGNEYNANKLTSSTLEEATKMYAKFLVDHHQNSMNEFTKEELEHYTSLKISS